MRYIAYLLLTFWVVACSQPKKSHSENSLSSDTIRYAQGFTVHHFDGYTAVEVRDPWDSTRLLQRYLLVDRDRPVPGNLPKGTVVQVPAQNVVVYTSVHAAIIDQLGETGRIIGVCEPRYMDTPAIREGLKAGRIADMGEATAPNVEMMIDKGAELVIVSPFQNSG
jgi:iron complex transport system substrate-binding protein